MTTAGFVPGGEQTAPSRFTRVAAASSLLLGALLVAALPVLTDAAFYVGVLAGASAAVAISAGYVLWSRAGLVPRAVAALGAGATLAGVLLEVLGGLPGAAGLGRLTPLQGVAAGGLAVVVLVFLLLDARRRRPDQTPEHPYAL
jgi:hypothetical protein